MIKPFCYLLLFLVQDNYSLTWKFAKGDRFTVETSSQLKQSVRVDGKEFPKEINHLVKITYTVDEIEDDGTIGIEIVVDSMNAQNTDGSLSSGNNAILNQLLGSKFKIKLQSDLQIKELDGYDELLQRVAGDDPSLRRVVQALLSEELLKRSIAQTFDFIPQRTLSEGETWKREANLSLGPLGSISNHLAFKLVGKVTLDGHDLVKLEYRPKVKYSLPASDAANPELAIVAGNIFLEKCTGIAYFDSKAGRLHSADLKLHLKGGMKAKLRGKEVPVDFEQTQSITTRILK
ncbi:MAG TPA: DUF6263 family protein [Gemmatales bacterium]|nr:DUF6263 family protein [Gemmatales bacterium]